MHVLDRSMWEHITLRETSKYILHNKIYREGGRLNGGSLTLAHVVGMLITLSIFFVCIYIYIYIYFIIPCSKEGKPTLKVLV